MTVSFVTGTDTGVGKTVVIAALATVHHSRGDTVAVVKPAQTGVDPGDPGDVDEIRRLAGMVDVVEGVRLTAPLAPDRAAALAGATLPSVDDHRDLILGVAATHDRVLVEGAGGVAVRLGEAVTLLDIAEQVRAAGADVEWYVVCGAHLGTLNHSTLTVQAIRHRGFHVRGLVIGAWPAEPGPAEQHNLVDLPGYTGVPVLAAIPYGASVLEPPDFRTRAREWLRDL